MERLGIKAAYAGESRGESAASHVDCFPQALETVENCCFCNYLALISPLLIGKTAVVI